MATETVNLSSIKDRILALAETLLEDNNTIPAPYRPVVKTLMRNYLKKADPEQVEELLIRIQVEIIPFILTGQVPDDGDSDSE